MGKTWRIIIMVYFTLLLGVALVILAFVAIQFYKKKALRENLYAQTLKAPFERHRTNEDTVVIRIDDIDREKASQFIRDYYKMKGGGMVWTPEIEEHQGYVLLKFSGCVGYTEFCYLVNYMVYSEKPPARHKAIGWYQTNDVTNLPDSLNLSNTILMMFVPDSDVEYDNVYFVNKDGTCFKQEFAWPEHLFVLKDRIREYEECPR